MHTLFIRVKQVATAEGHWPIKAGTYNRYHM